MANPFIRLLIGALRDEGVETVDFSPRQVPRCDIVHVHWPEWILDAPRSPTQVARTARLLATLALARRRGARLVWTVHNLGAHDPARRGGSWRGWDRFTRLVDGFISLTEPAVAEIRARFPRLAGTPAFVVPHGHYRDAYPNEVTQAEARDRLGVAGASSVAVFLGQVRPYKNVPALIETFGGVAGADAALVIAGRPSDGALREACVAAAAPDPRVRLRLELVPPEEVQYYASAAGVVVLPYRESLNSGAALLALSFDRPVLAPAAGAFVELEGRVGPQWVRTYDGDLDPATLAGALGAPLPAGRPPLEPYSWPCVAAQTVAAYATVRQ